MKRRSGIQQWHESPGHIPDDLNLLIEGAVEAGVFGGKSDTLREFVREYFEDHENERIAAAVALYERERITLGDAARLADVELRLGLVDEDDAVYEVETASELEFDDEDSDNKSETFCRTPRVLSVNRAV